MCKKLVIVALLAIVSLHVQAKEKKRSPFFFTCGYRLPLETGRLINSGKGLYFEAGFSPLKIGATRVGFFGGWGWKDNLWATSFDRDFRQDYRQAINQESDLSALDSAVVSASADLFDSRSGRGTVLPGCSTNSFHEYTLYYGLIFTLPVERPVFIKIYRGSTRSHYQGNDRLVSQESDYEIFQLRRRTTGCELMVQDLFGRKARSFRGVGISVYYEYASLKSSKLYFDDGSQSTSVSLARYVSGNFLNAYAHQSVLGIKVSLTVQ